MYYLFMVLLISVNVVAVVLVADEFRGWWVNLFAIGFLAGLTVARLMADRWR